MANHESGFTLVEIAVYLALLGALTVFIANFLIHVTFAYQQSRAEREALSNARLLLETLATTVASAQSIYFPTSQFHNDAGQLSLVTAVDPNAEHVAKYIDFWIDAGRFMMREEGVQENFISALSVQVVGFRVEPIMQGLGREAVRATLTLEYANARHPSSITLHATSALRGNY